METTHTHIYIYIFIYIYTFVYVGTKCKLENKPRNNENIIIDIENRSYFLDNFS